MADQEDLFEVDYRELLEYLRGKVRQFGFHEADGGLGSEIENIDSPAEAFKNYIEGFLGFLKIFSEESINNTKMAFHSVLEGNSDVPFLMVFDDEESQPESVRTVNFEEYRHCWQLVAELRAVIEKLGLNNSQNNRPEPRM